MRVEGLDYGWESVAVEVPDSAVVVTGPESDRIPPALGDPYAAVREAIANPYGMPPLADLINDLRHDAKITIAINSHLGIAVIGVPIVLEMLDEAGISERNVQIIAAPGMHPKLRRSEFRLTVTATPRIEPKYPSPFHQLPPDVIDRFWPTTHDTSRLGSHDCADPDHLVNLGETEYGDLVEVNDCVVESDLLIYMGGFSGVPGIFGGYLAGGLSIITGLGSARSIMTHHSYPVISHPDSAPTDVHTQHMRKHKEAAADLIAEKTGKRTFYIEAALNTRMQWAAVYAGDGIAIREPQFEFADRETIVDIPHQADVFVAGAPHWSPYDTCHNPATSYFMIHNWIRFHVGNKPPLRKGGVAILTTPCNGTVGESRPADTELIELFNKLGHDTSRLPDYELAYAHRDDLTWQYRHAWAFHQLHSFVTFYGQDFLRQLASEVIFVGAKPETASLVGARSADTFDEAWSLACRIVGDKEPRTIVMPGISRRKVCLLRVQDQGS